MRKSYYNAMNMTAIIALPIEFHELVRESKKEGFQFLERLQKNWVPDQPHFYREGEIFYLSYDKMILTGCIGLSHDPYLEDKSIGRIRHLYVRPKFRSHGVGRALVEKVFTHAEPYFKTLRLRINETNPKAGIFYEKLGFMRSDRENETHRKSAPFVLD